VESRRWLGRAVANPRRWLSRAVGNPRRRLSRAVAAPRRWLSRLVSTPGGWLSRVVAKPRRLLSRLVANPRAPLVLLALVCAVGVGARSWHLGTPAAAKPGEGYIFDEHYYVSAARVIAGLQTSKGEAYAGASPAGTDPNGEHPQLGKLVIAGAISVLGDNTPAWRITAVLFGAAAILLMYWLVRCAGGGQWLALGAAALASGDNLWLVHSRIAVLDIYVVPFMLAGAGFYLKGRPIVAGLLVGVGCCFKEFGVYIVLVVLLLELMRALRWGWERRAGVGADRTRTELATEASPGPPAVAASGSPGPPAVAAPGSPGPPAALLRRIASRRGALRRPALFVVVVGVTYFTLLTVLDTAVTPYSGEHPVDRGEAAICKYTLIWRDACNHFAFMNRYAGTLVDHGHPQGIASHPTDFWVNKKAITYFKVTQTVRVTGRAPRNSALIWFRGEISRVLLITAWFAILLNLWWAIRRRDDLSFLVLAWAIGTWIPTEFFNLVEDRTTYLYYMVVVMPALYIAVARLLGAWRLTRLLMVPWVALFLYDAANLYPFRTLSGS
jgi:Dolichyl-phosphate-mannose-protein mannosyltransferase